MMPRYLSIPKCTQWSASRIFSCKPKSLLHVTFFLSLSFWLCCGTTVTILSPFQRLPWFETRIFYPRNYMHELTVQRHGNILGSGYKDNSLKQKMFQTGNTDKWSAGHCNFCRPNAGICYPDNLPIFQPSTPFHRCHVSYPSIVPSFPHGRGSLCLLNVLFSSFPISRSSLPCSLIWRFHISFSPSPPLLCSALFFLHIIQPFSLHIPNCFSIFTPVPFITTCLLLFSTTLFSSASTWSPDLLPPLTHSFLFSLSFVTSLFPSWKAYWLNY